MKKKDEACCADAEQSSCCKLESLLSVDERGQMILPKDMRERAGIRPGDKLALISWEREGKVCCFTLIKADEMSAMVQHMLKPIMNELK